MNYLALKTVFNFINLYKVFIDFYQVFNFLTV